jgi:hypothetical protein
MFEYMHHRDGRRGRGWSVWAAIVDALGPAEARELPELADPVWNHDHYHGPDLVRVSPLLTTDDVDLGTIYEWRD